MGEDQKNFEGSKSAFKNGEKAEDFELLPMGYQSLDVDGKLFAVNDAWLEILGYTKQEVIGAYFGDFLAPEFKEKFRKNFPNFKKRGHIENIEFKMKKKTGEFVFVVISGKVQNNTLGEFVRTHCIVKDITEEKNISDKIKDEYDQIRQIFNSVNEELVLIGPNYQIIQANQKFTDSNQFDSHYIKQRKCYEIIPIEECHSDKCFLRRIFFGGEDQIESNVIRKSLDGHEKILSCVSSPFRNKNGELIGIINSFRDVTLLEKLKEESLKTQKIESIGLISGGIAHDFNNYLTAILGNLTIAQLKLSEPYNREDVSEIIKDAEKASLQARNLSKQLLSFSLEKELKYQPINILNLIMDNARFVIRGTNIALDFDFNGPKLWSISGDPSQLTQVINNLVINAKQSMKKGGTIKISAENYVIPLDKNPYLLGFDLNPGNYIKITIEDEGGGIPKKNHNNIFEPFFTTKKTGTGLGLSVSYSIIKRHNGTITFESEEGIGTTFFILLPADLNVQNSESIIESEEKTASLNIFIMDDEEIIQRILSRMLENLGHQVTITSDIDDLVQKIEDAKKLGIHPNLIILDLIIHGKEGGLEAISILDNICPKAKLVISSGSINHPVMNDYIKYGLNFALHKPFTLEELKHAIETAFLN